MLAVALAVEFADELADGLKGAALPLIQHGLSLSYAQIGLLASAPILIGGVLELPVGLAPRRLAVLGGGVLFVLSLALAGLAGTFVALLAAFTMFYPASGAFVSLTQADLMDASPGRHSAVMARWTLAGSAGAVAGPPLLIAVLYLGGSWRTAYFVIACVAAVALAARWRSSPGPAHPDAADPPQRVKPRHVLAALRDRNVLRWLVLVEVSNLLLDVLTGFVAVYLVNVVHVPSAAAGLAVAVRLAAGLAGDACCVFVLDRFGDLAVLRCCAAGAAVLYPAFLLVPGFVAKISVLAVLSVVTAPWYPVTSGRLFASLPDRSAVAVTLSNLAGLGGGLGPLAVGLAAGAFGLPAALTMLAVTPVVILLCLPYRGKAAAADGCRTGR